jgi:predicted ATP-dependent endonuclease of OLD family
MKERKIMRIKSMTLQNFRRYSNAVTIEFENLTAFVGKNDVGKSSILEALDIFFNDGRACVKLDKDDIHKSEVGYGNNEISIAVCFENLPDTVIIDATNETTLESEYLLNEAHQLEVVKKYPNAGSAKVYIRAYHPTNPNCSDLLLKKDSELRRILSSQSITCADQTRNAVMRKAIWEYYSDDLRFATTDIDVTKNDAKTIWEKLQKYLPLYTLFQADRKNTDGDSEVQDPLKEAVKEILAEESLAATLHSVAEEVERKLKEVSSRTLEKLQEMSPDVANSLNPVIPSSASLKWTDVFKGVSITGDNDIPINKRGSGVKRLVLLNFFRAEAERRLQERNAPSIIYAIEEPETSQHTENQKKLIRSFLTLSEADNTQIIITTHSASIVKELEFRNLRLISYEDGAEKVQPVDPGQLPYPSLNEVNYLAFSEITEEYHNELYGFIEEQEWLSEYKTGKETLPYIRLLRDGTERQEQKILSERIRNQIHHPENNRNPHYTEEELHESIRLMRAFIESHIV